MGDARVKRPRKDRLHYKLGGGYYLDKEADPRSWQPADWKSSEEVAQIIAEATGTGAKVILDALKDAYVAGVERRLEREEGQRREREEEAARREANAAELHARLVELGLDDLFEVKPSHDMRASQSDGVSIDFVILGTMAGHENQATQIVSRLEQWRGEVNG